MKCQHCNHNEATTHIKKNVNGNVTEMHLCSDCARELGVMEEFSPESFFNDTFFGNFLGAGVPAMNILSGIDHCEYCGSTFNDIVKSGRVGCANCYSKFEDRLQPTITKMHGNAKHIGKNVTYTEEKEAELEISELDKLKNDLKLAIKEQRFEDAAVLRDKINEMNEG